MMKRHKMGAGCSGSPSTLTHLRCGLRNKLILFQSMLQIALDLSSCFWVGIPSVKLLWIDFKPSAGTDPGKVTAESKETTWELLCISDWLCWLETKPGPVSWGREVTRWAAGQA